MRPRPTALRAAAYVGCVALALATVAALIAGALLVAVAGEAPDAYPVGGSGFGLITVPDQPRSWRQSAEAVRAATVAALVVGVLATLTVVLRRFASGRALPTRRSVAAGALVPPAAAFLLLAGWLAANRGDARLPPDCGTFRFSQAAFRSDEPNRWEPQAIGLRECGAYVGRTPAQTRRLLGDPDPREPGQSRTLWTYHDGFVQLRFNGGRAQDLSP